jgi:hypothetical protein
MAYRYARINLEKIPYFLKGGDIEDKKNARRRAVDPDPDGSEINSGSGSKLSSVSTDFKNLSFLRCLDDL